MFNITEIFIHKVQQKSAELFLLWFGEPA